MGRVKLKIKTLGTKASQQVTYSKRRCGILKKAKELSILCEIDLVLVMFSPSPAGKVSAFITKDRPLEDILHYYATELNASARLKKRVEILESLRKVFQKLDHEVDVPSFISCRSQIVEEKEKELKKLKGDLAEVVEELSFWRNPSDMKDLEFLLGMEESLSKYHMQLQDRKEEIRKQWNEDMRFLGPPSCLATSVLFPSSQYQCWQLPEQPPPSLPPRYNSKWASDPTCGSLPGHNDLFGTGKQDCNTDLLAENIFDVFNGFPGMQQSTSSFQQQDLFVPGDDFFESDILNSFGEDLLSEDFLLGDIPLVQFGLDDDVSFQNWASTSSAAIPALDQQQQTHPPQPSETPSVHPETQQQSNAEETANGGDTEMGIPEA